MYFHGRCRLKFFSPIRSHVTDYNEQKCKKKSILQNLKKKMSGDMVKITFPPNLALICLKCSEKTCFTDDGRPRDDSSSDIECLLEYCNEKLSSST